MTSLVNQDPAASDVLGKSALALAGYIRAAPDFRDRVAAVESWAGKMLDKCEPDGAIGDASRLTIAARGLARIHGFVGKSGSGRGNFSVGLRTTVMTRKLFARTIRFDRALVACPALRKGLGTDIIDETWATSIKPTSSANAGLCRPPPSQPRRRLEQHFFPVND